MAVHLPKGTRDFLPRQMSIRTRVIDTLRRVFTRYGFDAVETPAFERIETLTGKYSDENDKLMYRIHKRGKEAKPGECDLGLRYDLTVPLARLVAMHPELRMPFKRYQIQPVWRADRPQKGRFREFYQCDVDILGTESTLADAECIAVIADALNALGFKQYTVLLNDRRILSDFAQRAGAQTPQEEMSVLTAIDKLDKIGVARVQEELTGRGFNADGLQPLWTLMERKPDNEECLDALTDMVDARGKDGVSTIREIVENLANMGIPTAQIRIDPTLARGSDYYTGPVFELHVDEPKVGSLGGGGRYDRLIGSFSGKDIPAVGFSFGLERILVVMEELGMIEPTNTAADILVTVFSDELRAESSRFANQLRAAGIPTDLYLGTGKFKSQFKYANARGYPYMAVIGPDEKEASKVAIKNLTTGTQELIEQKNAASVLRGYTAGVSPEG